MKSYTVELLESYSASASTIATCVKIIRRDLTTYRFTSLDKNIVIDGEEYISSYSFSATAYSSALGLQVENMEISGPVDFLNIKDYEIYKEKFYDAEVWLFSVNYKHPEYGKDKILYGTLGEIELTDKQFIMQVRGISKKYVDIYSNYYGKMCRARLGDSKCGVNLNDYIVTGSVLDPQIDTFLFTNYVGLKMYINATFSEVQLKTINIYDSSNELISISSISYIGPSTDFKCVDNVTRSIENLIDNDANTFVCVNSDNSGYIGTFYITLENRKNISKIVVVDNLSYNNKKITNIEVLSSNNYYNWKTENNVAIESFRIGDIISIPISYILEVGTVTKYKFKSDEIKALAIEDNYFQYGKVEWLTGYNSGIQVEVVFSDKEGNIELSLPLPYNIHNGDTFNIYPGCNHLLIGKDGKTTSGHCKTKFNNLLNFRGEPYLPNEDVLLSGFIAVQQTRLEEENDERILLEPVD